VGKVMGQQGLLKMPVSITAPGEYKFEWALKDGSGVMISGGSRELTLQRYANDQALVKRSVLAIREVLGKTPEAAKGLRTSLQQELLGIEKEAADLASLQAASPGAPPLFQRQSENRTTKLNARSKRALALVNMAPSILSHDSQRQFVVFEGTTWENRDVDQQVPTEPADLLQLTRRCVPGEHQPVSIKLLNVTLDPITVATHVETEPGGPSVTAHTVKPVATNQDTIAWDPIVPLGEDDIAIPSLQTREVWLVSTSVT
jgi:hypothetical protein